MKTYKVTITETLRCEISVLAKTQHEAREVAEAMYRKEEIVLSAKDHCDTDIAVSAEYSEEI